jgi:nicotinamidase-related amidase
MRHGGRFKRPDQQTALLVVDVQAGFDDAAWGVRNNPTAEANIAALLVGWRAAGAPIIHVHHDSPAPTGRLRLGTKGHAPKPEARPVGDEPVFRKRVNSAFVGTDLQSDLAVRGVKTLVIVGLTTNHCISTTARMACNLGYETVVVADATAAFACPHIDGRLRSADEVHDAALSDLQDEFALIVETRDVLAALQQPEVPHA